MLTIEDRARMIRILLEHLAETDYFCLQRESAVLFAQIQNEEWVCMQMEESGVLVMAQTRLSEDHMRKLLHTVCETGVESNHG